MNFGARFRLQSEVPLDKVDKINPRLNINSGVSSERRVLRKLSPVALVSQDPPAWGSRAKVWPLPCDEAGTAPSHSGRKQEINHIS